MLNSYLRGAALVLVCLSPFAATISSAACAPLAFTAAQRTTISAKAPNQKLFTDALIRALALKRCKANREDQVQGPELVSAATMHSRNMAKLHVLSHKTNVAGMRSLRSRAKRAGVNSNYLAENIGRVSRYQFKVGKKFNIQSSSACRFSDPATGKAIGAHTYASLATQMAGLWIASSGHRKNILNRKSNQVGAALAYDSAGPNCGHYYVTAVFAR